MKAIPLNTKERELIRQCPWCRRKCQYKEFDDLTNQYRVGVECEESFQAESDHGDSIGNDWGRSNWFDSPESAIAEWNSRAEAGESANQLGVW